jgi:hypothetical protein
MQSRQVKLQLSSYAVDLCPVRSGASGPKDLDRVGDADQDVTAGGKPAGCLFESLGGTGAEHAGAPPVVLTVGWG